MYTRISLSELIYLDTFIAINYVLLYICFQRIIVINLFRPVHLRNVYLDKNELKFLFSHFFVVP